MSIFSTFYKHFMQYLAITNYIFLWVILPLISLWLPIYMLFTRFWWLICLYALWYVYDFDTPRKGSRNWTWYKNSLIWKHFADYFPITLVKTAELPTGRNYIMGCHPHGVLSVAAFTHLCTNGTGFSQIFPGFQSTLLTLNGQFWFPFRREFGIALGGIASSVHSLKHVLDYPGKNRIVGIVIGGAEEALDAHPGNYDLNIKSRRGFCRYALQKGAWLVPSYSFGENDIFHQDSNKRGTPLREVQNMIKKCFGFCPPLFTGRGYLCKSFGILPFRRPITTVVGAPIKVDVIESPTPPQIEALHAKYCVELNELFEKHKAKYGVAKDAHLIFY